MSPNDPEEPLPPPPPPPGEWPAPQRKQRRRTRDILAKYEQPTQRFPWRIAAYSVVLAYFVFDLYILDGPLRRRIDATRVGSAAVTRRAVEENWVALVNGTPITRTQLDRAVAIYNFKHGIDSEALSSGNRQINQLAVLEELVEDELLRSHAANSPVRVDPAAIDAALARFTSQFRDDKVLRFNLRVQQLPEAELRGHVAAQLQQTAWIGHNIAAGITVSEEEARAWFEDNRGQLETADLVRARHIFLSTVDEDTPGREELIRDVHRRLVAGETDFAALASEYSEDPRTAKTGGDLDYFSRHRMPPDFANRVFALEPHTVSDPFRTALGWHIAEITDRKAARARTFEEVKFEILQLLETQKRGIAVDELVKRLRMNSVTRLFPAAFEVPKPEKMEGDAPSSP